ncbi:MAG: hypothetical protein JXR73_17120, partial [Candidatus Omnitrophica bacterium]|nr:hypothetical protein [Candidatus Omnitrophota bacterium]
ELKAFEYRRGPDGHISFGHPHGGHDDTVYALAWAIYAAQLKLPRDPPFDPPPPHRLGAEMVAAGEALRAR